MALLTIHELIRNGSRSEALHMYFFYFIHAHSDYSIVAVMAFDSRAAAVLKGGVHVCTTPNHNALYQPPMSNMDVSLCSDC